MKTYSSLLRRIGRDSRAASVIEFALLAPILIAMMFGVVSVGVYMQNFNAIRSVATDASRFVAVEYQKNNKISTTTIKDNVESLAISSPYWLQKSQLTVSVTEVTPSRVNGAKEFDLDISYALPDIVGGTSIDNITLKHSRPLFVLD